MLNTRIMSMGTTKLMLFLSEGDIDIEIILKSTQDIVHEDNLKANNNIDTTLNVVYGMM